MKWLVLTCIVCGILSCTNKAGMTVAEQKAINDSVAQTLTDYCKAVKEHGLTAEFQYLDHSPDFFWVPPGYTSTISYDSVEAVLIRNAPMFRMIDNTFDSLRIVPLTKELATYTAVLHSTMVDTTGKTTQMHMVETGTVIKRKDGWKLLSGQTAIIEP